MKISIDQELMTILREIYETSLSKQYWENHSASDWFQTESYCGGFEYLEGEFTFSYFAPDGCEYWFQFPISMVRHALDGAVREFEGRVPG